MSRPTKNEKDLYQLSKIKEWIMELIPNFPTQSLDKINTEISNKKTVIKDTAPKGKGKK